LGFTDWQQLLDNPFDDSQATIMADVPPPGRPDPNPEVLTPAMKRQRIAAASTSGKKQRASKRTRVEESPTRRGLGDTDDNMGGLGSPDSSRQGTPAQGSIPIDRGSEKYRNLQIAMRLEAFLYASSNFADNLVKEQFPELDYTSDQFIANRSYVQRQINAYKGQTRTALKVNSPVSQVSSLLVLTISFPGTYEGADSYQP
jgi:hypothetical protein